MSDTEPTSPAPHELHYRAEERARWRAAIERYEAGDTTGWLTVEEVRRGVIRELVRRRLEAQRAV
jgi:hypothetical protein